MRKDFDEEEILAVVDPDDGIPEKLEYIDVDAFLVGGSKNVTANETHEYGKILESQYPEKPIYQEPGSKDQVSSDTINLFDGLIACVTLNGNYDSTIGQHHEFFKEFERKAREKALETVGKLSYFSKVEDKAIDKAEEKVNSLIAEKYIPQAYVIVNPYCDAAEVSGVTEEDVPDKEDIRSWARLSEHQLDTPIMYIEGSGEYVGPELIEEASNNLDQTHLRYGGGIETQGQVKEILDAGADSVVIGTSLEEGNYQN